MQKLKKTYKGIPLWLLATILVAIIGVAAATIIGTVTMPWQVSPPPPPPPTASMTPSVVTLPIGTVYYGETKTVDPVDVADLTVANGAVDINVSLGGDYGGFNALSITVQLVQDGTVKYEAKIEPTIVVSSVLHPSSTGVGGWSDKTASAKGWVETCFIRKIQGECDLARLVRWVPGATITLLDDRTFTYPNTPFGYTYDSNIPETGYIFQNDYDSGESLQLVLVYPSTSAIIHGVAPGTYDVCIGFTVTAGNVESSGEVTLSISYEV
jgi:hypothetical protein